MTYLCVRFEFNIFIDSLSMMNDGSAAERYERTMTMTLYTSVQGHGHGQNVGHLAHRL